MPSRQRLTAIIEREDNCFVSFCPELDIASQGSTIEEAHTNLVEALTLFFETASGSEVAARQTVPQMEFERSPAGFPKVSLNGALNHDRDGSRRS
jgi:predicted RNase H-like HicB family nuclease